MMEVAKNIKTIFDHVRDVCIILRHPENRGKGAAIKTAFNLCERRIME